HCCLPFPARNPAAIHVLLPDTRTPPTPPPPPRTAHAAHTPLPSDHSHALHRAQPAPHTHTHPQTHTPPPPPPHPGQNSGRQGSRRGPELLANPLRRLGPAPRHKGSVCKPWRWELAG